MKKVGALSLATFYLLLTTGMYVCILHCAGDYFFNPHEKSEQAHTEEADHKEKKSCDSDEDCTCCNTHGQYAIKENIPSAGSIHFAAIALLIIDSASKDLFNPQREITSVTWPKGNAPPFGLKEPLYISYRSLLI